MIFIPLDSTVALAKTICLGSDEQDELLFRQWIWEGIQMMGVAEDDIKVCTILPKNFLAKKPEDCRRLIDVALYDVNGDQIKHVYRSGKKRIYPIPASAPFVSSDGVINPLWVDISEDSYNIVLGSNATTVAAVGIRYFGYPLDSKGLPLIRQNESLPLAYFCKFMWSLRRNENQSEIGQDENRWLRACDTARAAKKLVSNEVLKTITRNWISLIPNTNDQLF